MANTQLTKIEVGLCSAATAANMSAWTPFRRSRSKLTPGNYRTLWTVDDLGEILFTWPAGKRRTRAISGLRRSEGRDRGGGEGAASLPRCGEGSRRDRQGRRIPLRTAEANIPARVKWVRIGDLDPTMKGELHHFIAFDEDDRDVGIVRRIEHGSKTGQWQWSMTRVHPGKPLNVPASGTE